MSSPYYQYPQPHLPNPTPADPQFNAPKPASAAASGGYGYASAPPVSSDYPSSAPDYSGNGYYSSPYPLPPPPSDQPPSYSLNPNPSYSFPHLETPAYYPPPAAGATYDYPSSAATYNPPAVAASSYERFTSAPVQTHSSAPGSGADIGGYGDQGSYGDGVYQYNGPKSEPYGARGTKFGSDSGMLFDDYGRPINVTGGRDQNQNPKGSGSFPKIVKAVPKVEEEHDTKGTVQKYRVKLLSEGYGQNDMDVLCQIGLDGICILDPATNRTMRIYPLESVDRWEVLGSYIFAFWAKTSVDVEPRRNRLKSNSYTTSNILDTVTAASIQVKEMGESSKPSNSGKSAEQQAEKKKAFADWMNIMKPGNVEKDHWVPDEAVTKCTACSSMFNAFNRRHHCRNCGDIFCDKCTQGRIALTADADAQPVRVCDQCMVSLLRLGKYHQPKHGIITCESGGKLMTAEVTQRLNNTKEASTKAFGGQSHDELVRKLRLEMNKNCKATAIDPTADVTGRWMREVACPTCTVHLQVKIPSSGSETIECSVCQQPFLVGADN